LDYLIERDRTLDAFEGVRAAVCCDEQPRNRPMCSVSYENRVGDGSACTLAAILGTSPNTVTFSPALVPTTTAPEWMPILADSFGCIGCSLQIGRFSVRRYSEPSAAQLMARCFPARLAGKQL